MELADEEIGALLSVGGKVDVDQVAAVQALVTADAVGFENREREAGKTVWISLGASPVAALTKLL